MAAAITSAAIGVAAAGYSIYQGEEQKKKSKQELNGYDRQALSNAAERIQISTVGTDLMLEESQRTVANVVDALQGGGSRVLGAGIPQLQAGINKTNRQIQKDLDDQVIQREYAIAQEEGRLTNIREQRDMQNIGALQSQHAAGDQNMWNGINAAIAATGSLGRAIEDNNNGGTGTGGNGSEDTKGTGSKKGLASNGYYNPFQNILPPQFSPVDFTTEGNMYKGNNIV
ncbi:MAG: hypothetical protein LBE34_12690 [Flavobacteriaceae bacterium]|jgi:hypothetical protein|nr:hypothetical protein [Flavobacteriaceae bacterium]